MPLDAHGAPPGLLTLTWLVSARAFRKNFIISKYVEKKYAKRSPASQCPNLPEAVKNKDIFSLLQAYAENMDLSEPVQAPLQVWHLVGGTIIRGTKQGAPTGSCTSWGCREQTLVASTHRRQWDVLGVFGNVLFFDKRTCRVRKAMAEGGFRSCCAISFPSKDTGGCSPKYN